MVKDEMKKSNIISYGKYKLNTKTVFAVWSINIEDLKKNGKTERISIIKKFIKI